jgi:hypothetical protein
LETWYFSALLRNIYYVYSICWNFLCARHWDTFYLILVTAQMRWVYWLFFKMRPPRLSRMSSWFKVREIKWQSLESTSRLKFLLFSP